MGHKIIVHHLIIKTFKKFADFMQKIRFQILLQIENQINLMQKFNKEDL